MYIYRILKRILLMTVVNSLSNRLIQACTVHKFLYFWIFTEYLFILPVFQIQKIRINKLNKYQ